ncbi:MAG: hypothetical protein ACE5OZ_06310 [Candidatus Heimdallarchaeota archaeon]
MPPFDASGWLFIGLALLGLIPTFILLRYYQRTRILDHLLFALVFLTGIINQIFAIFWVISPPSVVIEQGLASTHALIFFWMFLHAIRLKWEHPPKIVWYSGTIWYAILQFSVLLYEKATLPDHTTIWFVTMRRMPITESAEGAGLITQDGTIIMGTGYEFLLFTFRLFVLLVFIYAYWTTEFVMEYKRLKTTRNLWILSGFLILIYAILLLGYQFYFWDVPFQVAYVFNFFALVVIAYVTLAYPEGVLLSQVQVERASPLREVFSSLDSEKRAKRFGLASFNEFIRILSESQPRYEKKF